MLAYLRRRVVLSLLVLVGVTLITFMIVRLVPGDPVVAVLGRQAVSAENAAALRDQLGLNDSLLEQYVHFVGNLMRGDLGRSIRTERPVWDMIGEQLPSTIALTVSAMAIALTAGFTIGTVAALRRDSWTDRLLMFSIMAGVSMPSFWLGMLLIMLLSVGLNWVPAAAPASDPRSLILPALTLGIAETAVLARIIRASLLDVLGQPYLTVAHAKGLRGRYILFRHALPNALIPIISIVGLQFGLLLSGSVVVESLFARPGLGRLTVTAVNNRDFPVIQGIVLVVAVIYLTVNTLTDVASALINPRVRLS